MCDEAVCVGPAPALQSYLNIDAIIAAMHMTGAQVLKHWKLTSWVGTGVPRS
jgi:acetyl/propionyl-CoA carboxylase alpha subunit